MTNQINKISTILSYLILSLILTSCTQGDRGFIASKDDVDAEIEADIFITGGAVKGPLINTEINIYKFELDQGPIHDFNNALSAWFALLDENELTVSENILNVGDVTAETAIKNIREMIQQFGYITELKSLKSGLAEASDFSIAKQKVQEYVDLEETNSNTKAEVKSILNSAPTLNGLKKGIADIESLTDKLMEVDSFSTFKKIINEYRSDEGDTTKIEGFSRLLESVNFLSQTSSQFKLSDIKSLYSINVYDKFLNDFSLQDDPTAKQNISLLKTELDNATSVNSARLLIEKALRQEGNLQVKSELSQLLSKIITVQDAIDLVLGHEALYHDFGLRQSILSIDTAANNSEADFKASLDELYQNVTNIFKDNINDSFRNSLIIKDEEGDPLNRLSFGLSNSQGLLPGLNVGDYRGFIYMETLSLDRTIDLNSGTKPIIDRMETIFHTDDILGYGDNDLEDKTIYYLLNGEIQRNSEGEIITDSSLISVENDDKLLQVRPSYFATPLTTLALGLALEKLQSISLLQSDYDLDSLPDNKITESVLKSSLNMSSDIINESIGIGFSSNIFQTPSVRLPYMQYSQLAELAAIQHRISIENFSSFINNLMELTNLSGDEILLHVTKDLSDNQMDGRLKKEQIPEFSHISEYQYLFKKDPTENIIPGTNLPVSDTLYVMDEEFSTMVLDENLSLFPSEFSDLTITNPSGGVDSDLDGVLDNDDEFPNDPAKIRDLNVGYAGIWSVNYNSSETEYMPFNKMHQFQLNVEQIEANCTNEPCLAIGDSSTLVLDNYTLISAPSNNDFALTEPNDNSTVGFSAFATTPGDYLIKAELTTSIQPIQTYTFFVPIHVIDPKSIEIKFQPTEPQPGETVSVLFKATKAICHLYAICAEINLYDNQDEDDYLPLSLLNDVFSINQTVLRNGNSLSYSSVNSVSLGQQISNISSIQLNDTLSVSVRFNAGSRSLIAGSYEKTVGNDKDADADGTPDITDFYPLDSSCSLEKDGLLDTNNDEQLNSLDSPTCFATIQSESTLSFDVLFLNETWFYNPDRHFIIRKNKYLPGYNGYIKVPTLQGTKEEISLHQVDPISKRVYFAYKNGAIDYFSLEEQSLKEFLQPYLFNTIKSMNLLGTYLLVEYVVGEGNEVKLFNKNSNLAVISSDEPYPTPGNAVSISIDKQNLFSATNSLLSVNWSLERVALDQTVEEMPVQISEDGSTLLSGQTVFGDVLNLKLQYEKQPGDRVEFEHKIFTLGVESVLFTEKYLKEDSALIIDLPGLNASQLSVSNTHLYVKWFKNDADVPNYAFSLSDKIYPFIYEESNFVFGDMVRGDLYISHGNSDDLLITSLEGVILGDIDTLLAKVDIDKTEIDLVNRQFNFSLLEPSDNNEYLSGGFLKPVWKINNKAVLGENSFTFPTLISTNIKYGDLITVNYEFSVNGISGETIDVLVANITPDPKLSKFSLSPGVAEVGDDIELNLESFTDEELLNLDAKWRINGILDTSESDFVYPGAKLKYGDFIELILQPSVFNSEEEINFSNAYLHIASSSVGVNLESLSSQQPDPLNDLDSDGDGVPNFMDYARYDNQCHLSANAMPDDTDSDGISDLDELLSTPRTNPNLKDSDNDGLSDYEEIYTYLTDPSNPDTDSDGYLDGVEVEIESDPLDVLSPGASIDDNDFDGLSNKLELVNKTKVNVFDTDKDGLSDWYEINISLTDPLNPDEDGDMLSDGVEVRITETNPKLNDSDNDGLDDGIEVVLKLNPNSSDTDGNSILDPDELGFDFDTTIPSILNLADLSNYNNDFSTLLSVNQGVCFKTWLANNKPTIVKYTNEEQINSSKSQEVSFTSEKWNQIIRFDAQANAFTDIIDLSDYSSFVTSVSYDATNSTILYVGFSDGVIRRYNTLLNVFDHSFNTGYNDPISTIINQSDILLAEQMNAEKQIQHAIFSLINLGIDPIAVSNSHFSYKNSIWSNNSSAELISFDQEYSSTSFIKESFDILQSNPITSSETVDVLSSIETPLFIEHISGSSILRFGNGSGYNLTQNKSLGTTISPYGVGFEHQIHRVLSQRNSSLLELTTQSELDNDKFWKFNTQLTHEEVLTVLPVGYNVLAISFSEPSNTVSQDGKISFQYIVLGDEDGDNLPDWWNNLSKTSTTSEFENFQLSSDATIPSNLDGTPNSDNSPLPPVLLDSDNDNICDHWEITLFNTNPQLADTDSDGMSDSQELGVTVNYPLDCQLYPTFSLVSDPHSPDSDGDGLLDGEEAFVYFTNPLKPDTDGDGLTDHQEVFVTNTDPKKSDTNGNTISDGNEDSDLDGLSDSYEINTSNTDWNNADSDGDKLSDFDEVYIHGTNPNNSDSDGDGLSDVYELHKDPLLTDPNPYKTDPSSVDTDQDGVSDYIELNIDSIYPYKTDPTNVDTDLDGLTDLDEFEFIFEYTQDQLLIIKAQNNEVDPLTMSNPNNVDSDNDGICDKWEILMFSTNPAEADTDFDGLSDAQELGITLPSNCEIQPVFFPISDVLIRDTDNDGILDGHEVLVLNTNPKDKDSDDNGVGDGEEDPDLDGLTNVQELYLTKTDPLNKDSDDGNEGSKGNGINDGNEDSDDDGLTNIEEVNIHGTDPRNFDTDNDGISDKEELDNGYNPNASDSDDDGLSDDDEINIYGTLPNNPDTDGDGLNDGDEIKIKANPLKADTDNDYLIDGLDDYPLNSDADSDGIPDGIEFNYLYSDYTLQDSDSDSLSDGYEAWVFAYKFDSVTNTITNDFIKVGVNSDVKLNSKLKQRHWPEPVKFLSNNKDRLVVDLVNALEPSIIEGKLYIQRYSDPTKQDSDGDQLLDSTEFEIERAYGVEYHIDLEQGNFNPLVSNAVNFKVSNPWSVYTQSPNDFDSDGDGIHDQYESKYTLTDPKKFDTNENGISDGLENEDGDLLNNMQEILFGSDPNVFDVSSATHGLDTDSDGLLDVFETKLFVGYSINSADSNSNGIPDGLEDEDGDSLTNIQEMEFQTDPLTKDFGLDSDGDGLSDYQELTSTLTNILKNDSNGDTVLDHLEDFDGDLIDNITELQLGSDPWVANDKDVILDSDSDGLTDYQEIQFTLTDPMSSDSDSNGIDDAFEDLDGDGLTNLQEMKLGTNPLVNDSYQLQQHSDNDGLVDIYEIKITNTNPLIDDTDFDGVLDGLEDYDGDGLTGFVEILLGTDPLIRNKAADSDYDGLTDVQEALLTLTDASLDDSDGNGVSDADEDFDGDGLSNLQEVLLSSDPLTFDLTDAQKDADDDHYNNLLDQNNDNTSVINADSDSDSLPDGLEILILGTDPSAEDTDGDGLNDQIEVKDSWSSYRVVASNIACTDTEIRLSSVAGKDYCYTIEYISYPTLIDSDNDGVADRSIDESNDSIVLDHYPLDASCYLLTDGFIKSDLSTQCFSSWMGEEIDIDIIKYAEWVDTSEAETVVHADILFFDSVWDAIVVHNALTGTYSSRINVKKEINAIAVDLVDFEFSEVDKLLYLLYSDSTIETFNVQTKELKTLGNFQASTGVADALQLLNSNKLIVGFINEASTFSYSLINSAGANLSTLENQSLDISDSVSVCFNINKDCSESVSIYGFIKGSANSNINLGRLDVDLVNDMIMPNVLLTNTLSISDGLKGPIKLAQSGDLLQLGSGQIFNLLLEDTGNTLTLEHSNKQYQSYYDFVEVADHFVGVVDIDLTGVPGSEDVPNIQNGLIVTELDSIKDTIDQELSSSESINELKELNQYLLPPQDINDQVLKLIPFSKNSSDEVALVMKSNNNLVVSSLGLFDEDGDLMTGLYERIFGLDDTNPADKFLDLDMDGLTNIEEYFFATDPTNEDTDDDGWFDIDEILNGTNPNNNLSF